jgi:hypothetical protein
MKNIGKAMANLSLIKHLGWNDSSTVLRQLQNEGITAQEYAAIGKYRWLLSNVKQAILSCGAFLTPPEEQIKRLLRINRAIWKNPEITKEAIEQIRVTDMKEFRSHSDELMAQTLVYETGDPMQTLINNLAAMEFVYGLTREAWPQDLTSYGLTGSSFGVWSRKGAKPRPKGLHWILTELGRSHGPGYQSKTARLDNLFGKANPAKTDQGFGIGQELPALIAMHPGWVQKVRRREVPGLFAPDIELNHYQDKTCMAFGVLMEEKKKNDDLDLKRLLHPPKAYPIGLRRGPSDLIEKEMGTGHIVYPGVP